MNNPEILKTTCIIYGFVFTSAIILTLGFRKTGWGRNMTQAILSWLVIFILFIGTAFAGEIPFTVLICIIATLAVREFYGHNKVCGTIYLGITALLISTTAYAVITNWTGLLLAVPPLSLFVFLPLHMIRYSHKEMIRTVSLQVFGFIYWGWLPMYFLRIRHLNGGFGYIILLATMIALNDNIAYYTGKLLGKNSRKMAPVISPNKTWTGFIGGFFATLISALLFHYTAPEIPLMHLLIIALIVACVIPVGDLAESAMKRDLEIKDSGTLIPGHGGVMDRFDSWFFSAPFFYYALVLAGA